MEPITIICNNCGVELEEGMKDCPLCGEHVDDNNRSGTVQSRKYGKQMSAGYTEMSKPQKKFTWEIVSIILVSGAITTFIVDLIINHRISWSEYTAGIGLTIFCYISSFAFLNQGTIMKITGGFMLSCLCLLILDVVTRGINWSVRLGIPLLFVSSLITGVLTFVIRKSRYKGINLIAYGFLAAAVLCISIEGILSFFKNGFIQIRWSFIVCACIVPVVMVLLFVHFRLKKGRSLEKTFHV